MFTSSRLFLFFAILLIVFLGLRSSNPDPLTVPSIPTAPLPSTAENNAQGTNDMPAISTIAEKLDTPWGIAFLPDGSMLVTERQGRVRLINVSRNLLPAPVAQIKKVREIGEGGLLGITIHPNFSENNFVYLYYTYAGGDTSNTLNRVVRMTYQNDQLKNEVTIVDAIPGASNHNGGRIKFGPDGYLYITTGDAQNPSLAQDKNSLAGKILRVTQDGTAAPGNPFDNLTYSYGHRNPQGIAWGSDGRLWETEHGPSGGSLGMGNDEVNVIYPGKNYGWPTIQGSQTRSGMETPFKHSGSATWAPAGAAIVNDTLYFGGLRGSALYSLDIKLDITLVVKEKKINEHFKNEFGRIREVIVGPDGMLYVTTSNRDGRGSPIESDDRIVRINPSRL